MNFGGRGAASLAPHSGARGRGPGHGIDPGGGGGGRGELGDRELLEAHVAGDARAFGTLVARHERQLWWTAKRNSRTESDAADALQEALLKALRSAPTFRKDSSVATWLHRIVVNSCMDRMRGRHGPPDGVVDVRAIPAVAAPRPDNVSLTLVMEQALEQLTPAQREVVLEVDVRGWPVADAAARLGIAVGTVKSRRARAREILRRYLEEHLGDEVAAPSRRRAGARR